MGVVEVLFHRQEASCGKGSNYCGLPGHDGCEGERSEGEKQVGAQKLPNNSAARG